jgi:hypothetical protein
MAGCCPTVPQQPNLTDCGLFVLQFIESFFAVGKAVQSRGQFLKGGWNFAPTLQAIGI